MEINLKYYGRDLIFQADSENGSPILVGQTLDDRIKTFRPMELLLISLASCSSIDIVRILKKQKQDLKDYHVNVIGLRGETKIPSIFETITLIFSFDGEVSPEKAKKAVSLSLEKYCSVSKIIEETANIEYQIVVNNTVYEK